MRNRRTWIGLIIILLIYGFAYQEYEGVRYLQNVTPAIKHLINFTELFLVAVTGYYGWTNYKTAWVKFIWAILYAIVIVIITVAGLFDVFFHVKTLVIREFVHHLRFFFISPIPYSLLFFLSANLTTALKKNTHTQDISS